MGFRSGNGGRPKGATNRLGRDVRDIFKKLGGPGGHVYADRLHHMATGKDVDPHVQIKALSIVTAYCWGKPIERHEVSGADGGPVQTVVNHVHQP